MIEAILIGVVLFAVGYAYKLGGDHREAKILSKRIINVRKTEKAIADEVVKRRSKRDHVDDLDDADRMWDKNSGDSASNAPGDIDPPKPNMG